MLPDGKGRQGKPLRDLAKGIPGRGRISERRGNMDPVIIILWVLSLACSAIAGGVAGAGLRGGGRK